MYLYAWDTTKSTSSYEACVHICHSFCTKFSASRLLLASLSVPDKIGLNALQNELQTCIQIRGKFMVHSCSEFERHLSPNRLEYSSWAALARCLGPTWDHLGSVLGRFSRKNGTKMASKSAKSLILCQDCSKTEKFEPRLARKFLLGASRAALGRCLGPAWKHLGSILGAFW